MYQVNVPQIYQELEVKTLANAKKVIILGTILAAVAYIVGGIFGYIAFSNSDPADLDKWFSDNILSAPYQTDKGKTPIPVYISLFGMMFVVVFAVPFCILPAKDSIEEVGGKKWSNKQNYFWTLMLNLICLGISLAFNSIKTPISILGATTNSAIGFLLPICYYLKMEKRTSPYTNMKICCYIVFIFICVSSVIELVTICL